MLNTYSDNGGFQLDEIVFGQNLTDPAIEPANVEESSLEQPSVEHASTEQAVIEQIEAPQVRPPKAPETPGRLTGEIEEEAVAQVAGRLANSLAKVLLLAIEDLEKQADDAGYPLQSLGSAEHDLTELKKKVRKQLRGKTRRRSAAGRNAKNSESRPAVARATKAGPLGSQRDAALDKLAGILGRLKTVSNQADAVALPQIAPSRRPSYRPFSGGFLQEGAGQSR